MWGPTRVARGREPVYLGVRAGGDPHHVVLGDLYGAEAALDHHEGLREALVLEEVLRVAHLAGHCGPAALRQEHHRRDVLAPEGRVDPVRLAVQRLGLAEPEARDVEDVGSHVGEVRFGNGRATVDLVRATAYGDGIGSLLALLLGALLRFRARKRSRRTSADEAENDQRLGSRD